MCCLMSVVVAKSDYIFKANTVYDNLLEFEDTFALQAQVIDYAKCALIRNEDLTDYYVYGTYVSVYKNTNGYDLYFDDYHISLEVYDKQIIDYEMERF